MHAHKKDNQKYLRQWTECMCKKSLDRATLPVIKKTDHFKSRGKKWFSFLDVRPPSASGSSLRCLYNTKRSQIPVLCLNTLVKQTYWTTWVNFQQIRKPNGAKCGQYVAETSGEMRSGPGWIHTIRVRALCQMNAWGKSGVFGKRSRHTRLNLQWGQMFRFSFSNLRSVSTVTGWFTQ